MSTALAAPTVVASPTSSPALAADADPISSLPPSGHSYPKPSSSSALLFSSSSSPPATNSYLGSSTVPLPTPYSPSSALASHGPSALQDATASAKTLGHITSFIHGLSPICGLYFDSSKMVSASKSGTVIDKRNALPHAHSRARMQASSRCGI